jgi:uncharacterized membrane protein
MMIDAKFMARVALFAALTYVLALASLLIPNVSLSFVAVFVCGAVFGAKTGMTAGGLGMFLWTVFNPYGMAAVPITVAQVIGMIIVGAIGGVIAGTELTKKVSPKGFIICGLLGLLAGLIYQILVSVTLAWLFGPFWESLSAGLVLALVMIISNGILFPAGYPLVVKMAARERT